jgi:cadmium resistance protein CadD (predicted permease)
MAVGVLVGVAIITYCLTNIDDFCILIVFFARARTAGETMTISDVIIGQTIGFTILCAISLLGLVLGLFLPVKYITLIGIVPFLIGCKGLYELYKEKSETSVQNKSDNIDFECDENNNHNQDENENEETCLSKNVSCLLSRVLRKEILEVCTITLVNGGDNVAIYLPLFASTSPVNMVIVLVVFYALLVVWLFLTNFLVNGKRVADLIDKYGSLLVPIFLILLGFYILCGSVIFSNTPLSMV